MGIIAERDQDFPLTKVRYANLAPALRAPGAFRPCSFLLATGGGVDLVQGRETRREMFPAAICLTNAVFCAAIRTSVEFRSEL